MSTPLTGVDLDERGRLLDPAGRPVPAGRIHDHLAEHLWLPREATDLYVYVHGWQTAPEAARRRAGRLLALMAEQRARRPSFYPRLGEFRPWGVVVRWPSSSLPSLSGYRTIRDRAHRMGARGEGHAAFVIAHLLGYLDRERTAPGPEVLANDRGQYLHLVGHSFGGRFLCEAVQWAAEPRGPAVLGWSTAADARRPFTVDSLLVFQMAAPRDCFTRTFTGLVPDAPLRGPVVLTHSRHDRATGFWHLRAEGGPGIGHCGADGAPARVHSTRLLTCTLPYRKEDLDHRLVNVDAGWRFRSGRLNPSGAHSDFQHPESAHLMLSLADLSR